MLHFDLLKTMQAAKAFDDVQAGAHPQVKGVAQNDLRAHLMQAARHHAFDRAIRTARSKA